MEPSENNKDIYRINQLQNNIVQIEPPRTTKGLIQCMRCQQYGHTKTYCNRPFVCVKCGGSHSTLSCKKNKDVPARCALCDGPHPANYKGCEFYHKLLKPQNSNNRLNIQSHQIPSHETISHPIPNIQRTTIGQQKISYGEATRGSENITQPKEDPLTTTLNRFLEEFKIMFNQLIQQNSMVLNMLSTLINKMHN